MKTIFAGTPHTKFIAAASVFTWMIGMISSADAMQLQEARVTQVVNDVKLQLEQAAPRPAAVSDLVRRGTAVRTGTQSRSELTFADLTITRLGANTIFSFKEGTREMTLIDGAILFQVPKGSGGATIRTVGVTAAITGTTGIAEFHPATASHPQLSKWLCLEGTFHLYLPNGQSVEVGPGKMVATDGKTFSKVQTFDIAKLVSSSLFFTGFDKTLASMNLIMLESQNQVAGLLATTTTNPLDPARIVNVTSQAIAAEGTPAPKASPTPPITPTPPPPPPTPSKFGTPSVISSPVPYRITNDSVITTDPSITTNGVTDFGKIYRGQTDDGAFSLWAFGSSSASDTALRVDDFFGDPNLLPIAAFKFQSLSLTGDPTIDTTNGTTKLALIGVDGITSRPPGGALTFTGLDLLLLATVNGSINLTSAVSFQDVPELVMYARGPGADLTINSPISNVGFLALAAEDSIHLTNPGTMSVGKLAVTTGGDLVLQIGGSLLLDGRVTLDAIVLPGTSADSGINLTLNVAGGYTNTSATEFSYLAITNWGQIGGDASIAVSAANITTANNLDAQIANQNGSHIGGNLGGHASIDITANTLSVGGNLDSRIDNTGGTIGGNAAISMNISGNAAITNDATFQILGSDGATSASIDFNGGNYNAGGTFLSSIDGNGTITFSNASAHADVLKAGVFGANGVLNIGGGTLSADTTLKLYAPGSNGQINFISNVTLGGNSAKILAANSITIFNNVVVTIGGSRPADIYTGFTGEIPNANYTGFGGNGSTTGTFGGAGANKPQPIQNAPQFGTTNRVTSSGRSGGGGGGKATNTTINVSSSDELLAMLNDAHPGRDGRIRIPDSNRGSHGKTASRLNAAAYLNANHRAVDRRTASTPAIGRLSQ